MKLVKQSRTFPHKSPVARSRIPVSTVTSLCGALIGVSLMLALISTRAVATDNKSADAQQLVREMVNCEIDAQKKDQSLWQYREIKDHDGRRETREVVETREGTLDRLVAVDGRPLTAAEQRKEDDRLQKLATHSADLEKQKKQTAEDGERERRMLQMLPDAFRYQMVGTEDDLIHLKFVPNPSFRPSNHEAAVFHHLAGDLWIDSRSKRLARMDGTLISDVKFGGGMLGHLNKGGTFEVRQQPVGNGVWEMASLNVQMNGKALFFHNISVHERQECSNFRPVAANMTPKEAASLLKHSDVSASANASAFNEH
jgi:hypothetical protein